MKKLTESVEFITKESSCEDIKDGNVKPLSKFRSNFPNEAREVGVGAVITLVRKKIFLLRFREILMDAWITITYCS